MGDLSGFVDVSGKALTNREVEAFRKERRNDSDGGGVSQVISEEEGRIRCGCESSYGRANPYPQKAGQNQMIMFCLIHGGERCLFAFMTGNCDYCPLGYHFYD